MTVWTSVNEKPKYGVAIHNYQPCEKTGARFGLSIHVGELLEIACESENWYYGRRIAGRRPEEKGVVPKGYVRLRDCSVDRTGSVEIVSVVQPQIVQEITQTLRSWGQHWKHLYVTNNDQFRFIEVSMRTLLQLRSAILSGTLPLDQLKKVQRTAIYTMDRGNRELGMDLTVRCGTTGIQIDPRNVSTCQLYSFHVETSESIKQRNELGHNTSHSSSQSQNTTSSYSFFASVRNFVCKMSEDAELLMSLYDGSDHKHFTESYVVRWSKGGLASDIDQLHNLRVLFTDLGTSDIKREKVYLVCYVVRIGGMEPQNVDNRRSSVAAALASGRSISQSGGSIGSGIESWGKGNGMRRPLGVAAMDITHFLSGQLDVDDDKHHCVTFFPCEKDNLDTLLRRIIANKDLKGDAKTGQGLWLSVKLLRGDIKQIKEEVPHLVVGNVSIARKMGFPEVILPGDARNDLYLCLVQGCFTRGTGKSSDRNIQVTTRVCNQHGQMIPGVISLGGGVQPLNEYNSVVYYHEDKPRWLETFKICVPIEEFKQAHVVFLFKHRSSNEAKDKAEKPFALAYTPLMQPNGTTLNDTQHCLSVYKVDNKKWPSNDIDAAACYLSLPSQRTAPVGDKENSKLQRGFLSLSSKDSFLIGTNVCSTKLTQNVELLGVLNWCDHVSDDSLRQSLTSLQTVPGGEVVKFLQDILDALFSILTQADIERGVDSESDRYGSYDMLVFECLLSLISLVSDRKFHHFQPVLDLYIKESFCATLAYKKLCRLLSQLVLDADKGDNDVLLRSMKCLEYLVRFIVRSRELHSELTQRSDQHDFQQLFQRLLDSIVVMMRCDSKNALTSQGACIKYLPSTVPHIIQVFPDTQLTAMIGEIFDVLPLERLTKQRLIAILDLVQGPLFLNSECRYILLKHVTTNLNTLIINNDETNRCGVEIRSKFRSVDKVARLLGASRHKLQEHRGYSEQLELCVKILSEILTLLFRKDVGPTDQEFNHLTSSLLRTIIKATTQMDKDNPLVCQLVAVLLEMLRQMNVERYNEYLKLFTEPSQLLDFLVEVQIALRELVERPVFHSHWADMINLQYYIVLSTIRLFSATLKESFYDHFEIQVWSNWFHLAVGFLTRPSLQLEKRLPEQRRRVTSQFGDMRRDAAKQIHTMWFNLGQYKTQFVPTLVGPFLEMSLIPEIELRKATIPLFFDMMLCEYNSSKYLPESYVDSLRDVTHIKGNFNDFENEMIHKLDVLVEGGSGDADWSSLFVSIVGELCAGHAALRDAGGEFVHVVGKLLDTLLQYRALHDHSSMDYRMQATTTLLDFYSDIKRPEMYIRYVNKLCELHLECDNWTEAGLTQRLHAKLLQWSNVPLSTLLRSHRHPLCQTHRDLKEALYYEIIGYLDKGKMWELAVGVCKELVTQYEEEVFDYCHLSELYHMMSGFYAAIVKQPRPQPEYFRVGYYGKGFPHFLQNKVFIYKGKDYERLQDFSARTLNGLPNAELMSKLSPPGDDIKNSSEQYVQINAVEPIMSEHNRMSGKPISDRILTFHQHNNVNKFRYSRPIYRQDETLTNSGEEKTQNEFGMLWLERTELEIREKLPGILRWCPVIKSVTHEMSPLQVAVETMKKANRVLRSLVIEHRADHTLPLDPLTRKLNGMVDAAVMGGIVNYEKAFFTEDYLRAHPEHRGLITTLKDLIASQIPLLEFGIEVHRVRLPPSLAPLHQRIAECFEKMKAHVHNNYGKKSCDLEKEISMVTMRRQISVLGSRGMSFTENTSDNRWSEISTQTNHSVESGISMGRPQNNSLKAFTAQFNKQVNRGSLGSGISSGYASLGLPAARKRDKDRRRGRKSEVAPTPLSSTPSTPSSQWYTGPTPPLTGNVPNGNTRNAVSTDFSMPTTIVELRQELTPSRPLRSEVEKERRLSQRPTSLQSGTNSNRNSAGTTDSNVSNEDDPPPLPQKTVRTDHNVTNPLLNLTPISSESYYQAVNFLVTSSPIKSDNSTPNNSRSAMTSPVMMRQDYDTVFTPRDSALYKSLQPGAAHALRKNLNRKERAPTPPPKKRLHSVQN